VARVAVFPMLPERLSNDLTSLNEGEERLAVVVQFDVDAEGNLSGEAVTAARLRNHAKLDYESVGQWLDGAGPVPADVASVAGLEAQVRLQDAAAQRLLDARRRTGVLDLETVEPRPVVVNGRIIDLRTVARNRARDLIESFMVAANGVLARFLRDRNIACIRRVVQVPKHWPRLVELAADLGEALPPQPDQLALSGFLARRRKADPLRFPDLSLAVVKLLGAGEYVVERRNGVRGAGHFSLGAAEYAHATAPNRRYADLVTQRLVKAALDGGGPVYAEDELQAVAARCTERERAARKVERALRKRAAAALLVDRVGESFTGIITGVSPKGTFVRVLAPPIEGRVVSRYDGLDVGDTVRVRLLAVDAQQGFIDFEGPAGEIRRKLDRQREKRQAASRLAGREGETFDGVVTGANEHATWVRVGRERASGRIVRGRAGLREGQQVSVVLLSADAVHGFIDFEVASVEPRKHTRMEQKRRAAVDLVGRVGQTFDAVVTGANAHATWVRIPALHVEGRLVRGRNGLRQGDGLQVVLLAADPRRGYIDFARWA
jgi:exoribonuclease R